MKKLLCAALAATMLAAPAFAGVTQLKTTYTGERDAGVAKIAVSITTDGTIGALGASNILAWSFTITPLGGTSTTFDSTGPTSEFSGDAAALVATSTELKYAPTADNQFVQFSADREAMGAPFYGATSLTSGGKNILSEYAAVGGSSLGWGNEGADFTLGTAQPSAIPEPATWAMMIIGFGLVGSAMRHRPARVAA